jgi:hypothetical protein
MTTPAELRDFESRPRRYWNIDGIPELVMGLVWIVWGLALVVGETLPRGSAAAAYYWMCVPAILVLSGVAATWLTRRLKARLTDPRTGYVELRQPGRGVHALTALIAIAAAAVLAGLVVSGRATGAEHMASPAVGVILSLAFVAASVRQKAPSFLALAGVALALGVAFAILKLGLTAMNWLFVGLGAATVLTGGWRLRSYLARHPAEMRP